jgi:hypothetical protein
MQFPDRSREIAFHRDAARRNRARGDIPVARASYFALVESVRQQNINLCGALQRDLDEAKREYSEFVKADPLYQQIRDAAVQAIRQKPGILQTEMYTTLSQFQKTDVQYALYFGENHGFIARTKKGRTYALSLASHAGT